MTGLHCSKFQIIFTEKSPHFITFITNVIVFQKIYPGVAQLLPRCAVQMDPGFSYFVECLRELLRQCSFQRKEKCTWTKLLNLVLFKSSAKKGTWTAGRPNATGPCVEFNWFHILSYPNLNKPTQVSTTLVLFDSLTLCIPAFFCVFFLFICFNTLFLLPKLHKRCLQICKTVVQAHLVMERLIQAA